ncbi:MAG: PBP1A family penicillin-binding protein, partial [Parcubacteria group bacterium]
MQDKSFRNIRKRAPASQKNKRQRKKRTVAEKKALKKKILIIVAIASGVGLVLTIGVFAYLAKDLPSPGKINKRDVAESTKIYDRTGDTLLYEVHGEVKRTLVQLDQVSDDAQKATIAAEDRHFYKHFGFDPKGITRSIFSNVTKDTRVGGSTITQQFVKNSILTSEKTYSRKIKELILALEIELKFSKEEILQMYLNEIPYGSNAYGIEAASQEFFNKSAKDLTLAEATLLASLPQRPTYLSPHGSHTDELKERQEWVLDRMADDNYITREEAEAAKNEKLNYAEVQGGIIAPHFVMYVKEQLVEKYGEETIEQGGLQIHTTLDLNLQRIAEKVVPEGIAKNAQYNASNAALVAVDPKNGQILAMQGSKDYWDKANEGNVNVAIRDRQPGSSFKPFAYAKAFEKGYTPNTIIFDLPTSFSDSYKPENYDRGYSGPVNMRKSLAMSKNVTSVKTLYLAGVEDTIELARNMGITTLGSADRYGLSLVLGGGEVKLIDETAAFGVFANNGVRHEKTAILKIINKDGKVVEDNGNREGRQVIDAEVAKMINDILSDNGARSGVFGSSSALTLGSRPVAAKTGTTQEYRDGWTVGYTPGLAAGVWAGNNDNAPMKSGAAGIYVAAPIWNAFMSQALDGVGVEQFDKAQVPKTEKAILNGQLSEEQTVKLCKPSMKLATADCPQHLIEEKTYKKVHTILYYVDKETPQGAYPKNPQADPQFNRWEGPVRSWAEGQGYKSEDPPTETDDMHTPDKQPTVEFSTPADNSTITTSTATATVQVSSAMGVKKVEFYVDDTKVGTDSTGP